MKNINIEDVKPLRNDPTKSQILIAVNFLEDAQKMRMAMGNRICASFRLEMNDAGDTSKDTKEEVDPEKEADAEEKKKVKIVKELVQKAVDEGIPVEQILSEGLLDGMSVVGE